MHNTLYGVPPLSYFLLPPPPPCDELIEEAAPLWHHPADGVRVLSRLLWYTEEMHGRVKQVPVAPVRKELLVLHALLIGAANESVHFCLVCDDYFFPVYDE